MRRAPACQLLQLLLLVATFSGCARSCKNDHPYVPYSIGDGDAPDGGPEPLSAIPPVEDAAGAEILATVAPAGTTRWALDGVDLAAPPERVFVAGLVRDFDGDGTKDAVAVVRGTKDLTLADELFFWKGTARGGLDAPASVAAAPSPAPAADAGCTRVFRLAQVGRRSVAVELGGACPALASSRWLGVVSFDRGVRTRFSATLVDPPEAPKLTVDPDAADRDGDGIDDLVLKVSIDAPSPPFEPMPRVTAKIVFFDRPAGLSREPDEPDASLRTLAQAASSRAARPKEATQVTGAVHQMRALYGAICAEGGSPRIVRTSVGSGAIACGTSRALEEAGFALARAHATLGDPARAIAALERAQLPPATKTAARMTEAQAWLAQVAPVVQAKQLRAVAAVPQSDRGAAPTWGPLAFDANGKLLVRTAAGVARVDPVAGDESEAPDVTPWKAHVVSPDGTLRWLSVTSACDGGPLRASFASTGPALDADTKDLLLPIATALGVRCAGAGLRGEAVHVLPLAWGTRGLEALVAGEPVLFSADLSKASIAAASLEHAVTPGAPRSPSGKVTVVATSQGIVVRAGKSRMFRAKELEGGYGELVGCAVSDDAASVACVRGGRAFVGTWDLP